MDNEDVTELYLPKSQIEAIMLTECSVDESIKLPEECVYLVTKATELFVQHLANLSLEKCAGENVDYCDVAQVVHSRNNLHFLRGIIPQKITVREWRDIIAQEGDLDLGFEPKSESSSQGEEEEESAEESSDDAVEESEEMSEEGEGEEEESELEESSEDEEVSEEESDEKGEILTKKKKM